MKRWAALALCCAGAVRAVPPDAHVVVAPGKPAFEKVPGAFDAVLVDKPELLSAELLPTGELLLEAKGRGVAHAFLFSRHFVRTLEVSAGERAPPVLAPRPACPAVSDAACYEKARAALAAGAQLELVLTPEGMQAELKSAQRELMRAGLAHVSLARSPYGLRILGAKDEAERRRAIVTIYPAVLGPLRLDGPA